MKKYIVESKTILSGGQEMGILILRPTVNKAASEKTPAYYGYTAANYIAQQDECKTNY